MSAITDGDRIERDIQRRIQRVYQKALDKSTKNIAEFLQIVAKVDSGEKQPPAYYRTDEQKALWRQGFLAQELQRLHVQELITEEIARAGAKAEGIIREATADVYLDNYAETVSVIEDRAAKLGVNASFAMPKRQEVRTLLDERNGVFSKIAYQNMGSDTYIRQKLQSEMAQATILGESQRKILERIRNVTGQSVSQAKRVAQTERNRVQSQARFDAAQAAAEQGVETYSEWRCRFVRSRDTHMARHGVRVRQGECFPGCNLRYPGDPNGSAKEVINCHCYLQVGVLLPGEMMDADGSIGKAENVDLQGIQAQNGLQNGTGKGIIKTEEMFHKKEEGQPRFKPISDERFNQLTIEAKKAGAFIIRGTEKIEAHLASQDATASTLGSTLMFSKNVCVTEVLEETRHFVQNKQHMNDDKESKLRTILNEIEAKTFIIENAKKYGVPRNELEHIQRQLASYEKELVNYEEEHDGEDY